MVRLKDIADNLNLSVMAVSKALRDAPDIGSTTKDRVRKEADRLGYIPNHAARSLRTGTTHFVGIVMPSFNEPICANIFEGLEREAADLGYETIVASSQHSPANELSGVTRLCERNVEGLFVYSLVRLQHRSPLLDVARRFRVPLVFLDHYPADISSYPQSGWVVPDSVKAGKLAAEHLLGLGHEKFIYLSGPLTSSAASEHYSGVQQAIQEAGKELDEDRVFAAGFDITSGRNAMSKVTSEDVDFTAVICFTDAVALGALEILKQQGLKVPKDVSLIGYGDGLLSAYCPVPLTTVRRPQVDLGRSAFQLWHSADKTQQGMPSKILPVDLVLRNSTGKASS